ncbi:hypothetical protein H4R23_004751 [Coemansia sp. Cherry 401B]|nr:hypothetical protein H4R23_004751 [Coemansia sp. Cherry 401B]
MRCGVLTSTVLALLVLTLVAGEQRTTQEHLDEANGLLQRGKYRDALESYDSAIARDPQNYLTYFKRATALLSVNRHASAIRDFTRVLELRPDFDQAYYQRARAYVKEGGYAGAESDLDKISGGSASLRAKAGELREKAAAARKADAQLARARDAREYAECVAAAGAVIRISPLYAAPLRTRAACRLAEGDVEGAAADLGRLVRLRPGDLDTQNQLGGLHYLALGERARGLEHVRACLRSDPDNAACKATYARLRALDRRLDKLDEDRAKGKWNACNRAVAPLSGAGGLLAEVDGMYAELVVAAGVPGTVASRLAAHVAGAACEGYSHTKKWARALELCRRVLDADPSDSDALGFQFDAQLESEQLDGAHDTMLMLEQAAASGGDAGRLRVQERRMQLERRRRAAARKDYYKILGVARDASAPEVKRAFRKMAQQWHPDRYRGDLSKDEVEAKMAEINQAYEVLMDEEKRAQYDQGHDPNDPNAGAGPGDFGGFGNPFVFQQGGKPVFFQQGGGGKQFSFQFGGPGGFPF